MKHQATVKKLVELVSCHTLSVELLAKAANRPGYILEKYYDGLKSVGFGYPDLKVNADHNAAMKTVAEHLSMLYELSKLTDEKQRIIKNFAILPSIEIPSEIDEWLQCDINDLSELCERGWLSFSDTVYRMHDIVKEAVKIQAPDINFEDCKVLVNEFSVNGFIGDDEAFAVAETKLSIADSLIKLFYSLDTIEAAGENTKKRLNTIKKPW